MSGGHAAYWRSISNKCASRSSRSRKDARILLSHSGMRNFVFAKMPRYGRKTERRRYPPVPIPLTAQRASCSDSDQRQFDRRPVEHYGCSDQFHHPRSAVSETALDVDEGMMGPCAINLHNAVTISQERLGRRVAPMGVPEAVTPSQSAESPSHTHPSAAYPVH